MSFGTSTIGACIVQVSLFSSVHINRFHCSVLCIVHLHGEGSQIPKLYIAVYIVRHVARGSCSYILSRLLYGAIV